MLLLQAACLVMSLRVAPRLVFEISEGFANSLVQSTSSFGGNFTVLDAQLANVYDALLPLTARYAVDVLIYPCHLYNASGYVGSARPSTVHPSLHRMLQFFNQTQIGVFLEIYSSGIMTQQVGPRMGNLPATPLHLPDGKIQPDTKTYIGLSMDVDTVVALKHT